ncbi:MAG: SprT family zinc-dependent metalloprotease [Candidatus Ratteibacteria bacterium]|jgi:predicted metal-dependent hydrolase
MKTQKLFSESQEGKDPSFIAIHRILFSQRRTLSIEIERNGRVTVRAPFYTSRKYIFDKVQEKSAWILRNQKIARTRFIESAPKRFEEGEDLLFLGSLFPLVISDTVEEPFSLSGGRFLLSSQAASRAKEVVVSWYRCQANDIFSQRLIVLSRKTSIPFSSFCLSDASSQWGSCQKNGTIRLSWKLVMAPPDLIDYVVFHELAHIRVHNHSRNFRELLSDMCPDWRDRKNRLHQQGHRYTL